MEHGRTAPQGAQGGDAGGVNRVRIMRGGQARVPPHLSKDQSILLTAGDVIEVSTPGGSGYGLPAARSKAEIERDIMRGYYTRADAMQRFGVTL